MLIAGSGVFVKGKVAEGTGRASSPKRANVWLVEGGMVGGIGRARPLYQCQAYQKRSGRRCRGNAVVQACQCLARRGRGGKGYWEDTTAIPASSLLRISQEKPRAC